MRYITQYLTDCRLRPLERLTVDGYEIHLTQFKEFAGDDARLPELREWLASIPNPRTRHTKFRAIRTYVRWCAAEGLTDNWIAGVRVRCPKPAPPITLTVDEAEAMIEAIPRTTLVGLRDRALYALIFYTGCRRDAIRTARLRDLDLVGRWLRVVSKNSEEQTVNLPRPAAQRLNIWLAKRPGNSNWIFPSTRHPERALCKSAVTHYIHRYAESAGIHRRVWVHLLRHSHATVLLRATGDLETVRQALNHRSLETTRGYAQWAHDQVRLAQDRVFG